MVMNYQLVVDTAAKHKHVHVLTGNRMTVGVLDPLTLANVNHVKAGLI